ncbi:RNase J family beta-CASP ribonuclease [Candidatus Saccharibacteria bacterium]|nr:RNase J family beta-CASP ribonuclease [Candidatus Saccharibacteria bacterium]MBR2864016.1 RNase J family beta-CASP ribonuclease [Candidatus Saccharibacteria bacterium]
MNKQEQERRAKLLAKARERLPSIKEQFEEAQNRHFNSNFEPGGKDAHLVSRTRQKASKVAKTANQPKKVAKNASKGAKSTPKKVATKSKTATESKKVALSVSVKKGEMVHHQRMLSQDVNAQATQHIIGVPVNKSRYNGYNGQQVTHAQLKSARPDRDSVKIIPIGGLGEFGIGKNMTIIEYHGEMVVMDMGVLFAGADYPGVNYMIPDIKFLEDNKDKVKAILFTHAHLDHIGACRHLLPKFNPITPIYGTDFTIGMIKKQMSELEDEPDLNYNVVDPFKHEKIQVSEHLSVEFIHVLHSIPGSTAIVVRTPNGVIYFSGDWRHEENPYGKQTDYERIDEIVKKEGIDLMFNESTNIDSPGHHPHSEYDVGDNLGKVMDHYANGRVIISCFSSQVSRIESTLREAAKRGRKVAFAGFSMINNVEVALRTKNIKAPKDTIMKMEDIIKLPDDKVTIVCTGSQGELNAVLNRMVTGAHKYIKIKATDTIVFSSNPIPGNEPHVVSTVDGLLREGAQVIQNGKTHLTNIGPLHLSGHAYYEDHVDFVTRLHPKNYCPYHGEFYMLQHNAEMAENVIGIPKDNIIVSDDGDIIEFTKDKKIKKNGRIPVGNKLYDDADQPVHEAVVKDRIHISREGIFVIVLTISKKTGRLVKTPDIVSRAFIYLDNSEDLIGKIRHYLRVKVEKTISTDPALKDLKEEIKEDVTHILYDATGHTPIVIPVINKV